MSVRDLTTLTWWKAAAIRAARTALVIAIPYVPASYVGAVPYLTILSAAALGAILSLLTSLAGLAESSGETQPWWFAVISRVVKTVAQALVAGFGTAVLLTDVNWESILSLAITAGFGSLLLAVLKSLPEAPTPISAASVHTIVVNEGGRHAEQAIPVVATYPVANDETLHTNS